MKVAVFAHGLENGSFAKLATTLIPEFQKLGIETEAVVSTGQPSDFAAFDFPVHKVGSGLRSIPALVGYLRTSRPDILMPMPMSKNLIGLVARQLSLTKTKVVITEHTTMADELYREHPDNRKMRLLYPPLVRVIYRARDGLLYPTEAVARDRLFSKLIDVDARPHMAIHNPLPSRPAKDVSNAVIHPWLTDHREMPVVLGVGRLMAQKGFDVLIRSVARLRDQDRSVRLIILGEGWKEDELRALIDSLDLSAYVDLPGYVENVIDFMRAADVFALSSRWETFGLVLVEAMAAGLPIVSTRIPGGPEEILEDGRNAVLVEPENADALAAGILRIIDDEALTAHLTEEGLADSRKYQPKAVAEQYVAFFRQVLGQPAAAPAGHQTRLTPSS